MKVKRKPNMQSRPSRCEMFKDSRWDFWEEGVSSSLLSSWLTCREQFRLGVVEGWRSYYTPLALAFGTCMHWCLEKAYSEKYPPNAGRCRALIASFETLWNREQPNAPTRQREVQQRVYGLAEAVLPSYFQRWAGDFLGEKYPVKNGTPVPVKWLALEKQFSVPYVFPDGMQTWIRGTRDAVLEDKRKDVWVFDSKCRSIINEEDTIDCLPTDLQQMLYLWAYVEETKKYPTGTVMNIVRRPGHRQGSEEDLKSFFARVSKEVSNPKKWDHYFIRFAMRVTPKEIDEWKTRVLDPIMADVRGWWEGRSPHYLNPLALVSKYGRCAMFNAITANNFTGLYRRAPGSVMKYQTDLS